MMGLGEISIFIISCTLYQQIQSINEPYFLIYFHILAPAKLEFDP